jgi:hypothetical protein
MARLISSGNYGSATFPLSAHIDSGTALVNGTAYASSPWGSTQECRLLKVLRLDGGTTADVITIIDKASVSTGIVLTRTGTAAGPVQVWDFGPNGIRIVGGFGITVSSGGTAGLYVYIYDTLSPGA